MWICKCERRRETLTYSVQKGKEFGIYFAKWVGEVIKRAGKGKGKK